MCQLEEYKGKQGERNTIEEGRSKYRFTCKCKQECEIERFPMIPPTGGAVDGKSPLFRSPAREWSMLSIQKTE
jgi:hypothetical protein